MVAQKEIEIATPWVILYKWVPIGSGVESLIHGEVGSFVEMEIWSRWPMAYDWL